MNYELAKELKDAGFPQDGIGQFIDVKLASPTLSELIEACGGESIIVLTIGKAYTTALHGATGFICNDSTPEEAIARLWLALNKK